MQWVVLVGVLATVAARAPVGPWGGYHDREGIPLAAAVRAAEDQALAGAASGRIFNGAPAAPGQFPYFGGLVIHFPNSPQTSACGSALVTSTRLLTAAHCWYDFGRQASMFTVVLGSEWLFHGGTRVDTTDVEMHAGWDPTTWTLAHDIAVIRIAPVGFSDYIQPINLATGAEDYAGQQAQAIGIGVTGFGTSTSNPFLAHITTPVLSNAECSRTWTTFVTDFILCTGAGANNANICSGDSGGPVTVGNVLVGLVSYGNGAGRGCEEGLPAGHSRVSAYHDWISARL